ncbi:biotin synthase, partial [Tuber magnatum]
MNRIVRFSIGVRRVGPVRWLATHAGTAAAAAAGDGKMVLERAINAPPKNTWTKDEISSIYNTPLMELAYAAATLHRKHHPHNTVQTCTLLSIKTGGCTEDCSYCAQSSRYSTGLAATKLSTLETVMAAAREAKANGSTRFCMGAAWRDMSGRTRGLERIKDMVREVRGLGMEVCVTLGMLGSKAAEELKGAGLTAYNHNLDTSREFYPKIITTRGFDERLRTIENVRNAGISVCTGGILGLGETAEDHVSFLHTLSTLPEHPESVPINALVPIKGTPLGENKKVPFDSFLRVVATARILMPASIVRLAAGRINLTEEQQVLAFFAGANAVFTGERMLTTECSGFEADRKLFEKWGLVNMKAFGGE